MKIIVTRRGNVTPFHHYDDQWKEIAVIEHVNSTPKDLSRILDMVRDSIQADLTQRNAMPGIAVDYTIAIVQVVV